MNNKSLIIKYYKLLKISIPCLIMAFLTGGIWLFLVMIDDIALENAKSSALYMPGLYIYLGLVIFNLFMFAYSTLRVRFGINGKNWKEIISELSNINSNVDYYTGEAATAVGAMAAGRLMANAENKTVANIGKGVQAVGAIETINVVNNQVGSMLSHVTQVAKRFNITLPSMKKWIVLIILFPFIVLNIAYIPRFIESNNNKQDEIVRIQNIESQISSSLETYFKNVRVDNPEERIKDSYDIKGYMENDKNEYIDVEITPEGNIKKVYYHSNVNPSESKEENIQSFNSFIKNVNELLGKSTTYTYLTSITQIPEEAIMEYKEKEEELYTSGNIYNYEYSFSYKIDSYDNQPYFYFTIETE